MTRQIAGFERNRDHCPIPVLWENRNVMAQRFNAPGIGYERSRIESCLSMKIQEAPGA
ncbi:MAG: hypothetical protein QM786_18085 [Breznakibacter sp.]